MTALQVIWFVLIGVLLTVYAILDGFDLGVGIWYLFSRKDRERRILLNSIGPVWDANEVWLLAGGGAIFAAFPHVYATVFSALYLPLMLVVFGLILRAVSIELRNEAPSAGLRRASDIAFAVGSIIPALLFGVAIGNLLRGLPLDTTRTFTGSFWNLLNPYALLIGLLGLAMLATHGASYVLLKTQGDLRERARRWMRLGWIAYLSLFLLATVITLTTQPQMLGNVLRAPVLWCIPLLAVAAIVLIRFFSERAQAAKAFVSSSLSIVALMAIVGVTLFPSLVPAANDPALSLTIADSSSSNYTLTAMLIIAIAGIPLVAIYTLWAYRTFRGTVAEGDGY